MLALIPPALSSLPGAPVTVHIDFDGTPAFLFRPSSNLWASGPAAGNNDPIPAFSIDGIVNDFSQAELDGITAIWQHVSEKFSPFNINVTTIAPPNYNNGVAIQLIVGGSNTDWYGSGGGVALENGFTASASNSGFAFSADAIDAGSTTLNNGDRHFIAETVAHEAGHLFGLRHQSVLDGIGNVIVEYSAGDSISAPIMGGSSNNSGKRGIWIVGPSSTSDVNGNPVFSGTQNDLDTLTRPGNVVAYRPDDFGSFSGSGSLNVNSQNGAVSGNGIIETNGDQDAFTFVATGPIVGFTVRNASLGGMLAPTLELIPISGAAPSVILSTTNTSATLTTNNATPGQGYVLRVSPQGNAYGSIGQYTISGNVGNFSTLNAGVLTVYGYEVDDDMAISYISSTDNIVVQNDIFGGSAIQLFPRSQVTSIVVNVYSGNDFIDLFGQLSALSIPVTVNGGNGNDTLHLSGTSGPDLQSLVDGSHGFNNATPFTFGSIENMIMGSFAGVDTFNISELASTTNLTINADIGNDVVNLAPNNPFGISAINAPVTIVGGTGNDTLNVGSGGLHAVSGLVTYHAGNEGNTLNLYDGANAFFLDYTITGTSITRDDPFFFGGVNYSGVSILTLEATQGPNAITLSGTSGLHPTIFGNGGDDDFVVGGGNIGPSIPSMTAIGGEGTDRLVLDDHLSTHSSFPWFVYGDTGDPATANKVFLALNEYSYNGFEGVEVLGGNGNTTFQVQSASVPVVLRGGGGNDQFRFTQTFGVATNVTVDGQGDFDTLLVDDRNWNWLSFDATLTPDYLRRRVNIIFPENHDVHYSNFESIDYYARPGAATTYVVGTSPDVPSTNQTSLFLSGAHDNLYLFPRDAAGNLTIKGNLGISGGGGTDTLVVEDSASSLPINYTFSNQFGPSITSIGGLGAASCSTAGDMESITLNAGNAADAFNINSFKSGSGLRINGGGGNDTVGWGMGNATSEITNISSFHYDGQMGSDTFNFNHGAGTSGLTYYRNVGTTSVHNSFGQVYGFTDSNLEVFTINASSDVDGLYLDGTDPGLLTIFGGGGGIDGLALGYNADSLENIRGPVVYFGGANGGGLSIWDGLDVTGDTFHVTRTAIGASPGDNLFGPGGSLTFPFSDLVNFDALNPGVLLSLGSGTDTVFAEPFPTARVTVNGNNPTASPGDTFRLSLAGVTSPVFTPNGPGAGTYTFGNAQAINYTGFETASTYLPGDYSGNGVVGPEDFNIWKGSFGMTVSPGASGDGNGDGKVDAADYTLWRDRLGATTPGGGAASVATESLAAPSLARAPATETTATMAPLRALSQPTSDRLPPIARALTLADAQRPASPALRPRRLPHGAVRTIPEPRRDEVVRLAFEKIGPEPSAPDSDDLTALAVAACHAHHQGERSDRLDIFASALADGVGAGRLPV